MPDPDPAYATWTPHPRDAAADAADTAVPQTQLHSGGGTLPWEGTPSGPPSPVPGYELLGELGRGGMGVVYKARQTALNRVVALKMILAGDLASPEYRGRFRAEAEAAARLQHPNIVQLYEYGEAAGHPYFTLEFVDGGSLDARLDGTPFPLRAAAELVERVARAMHYAHTQGVVHRDLKPANILLAVTGDRCPVIGEDRTHNTPITDHQSPITTPKVADFGLAKRLDSHTGATQSGAILGTPSYMSPEQAAGRSKDVGPATDTYALGAILYELLTGRPPFRAATPFETVLLVAREEVLPPSKLRPGLPRDLETVCLKCLRKQPGDRYATAAALADDLRRWLDGQPVAARPASALARLRGWVRRKPTAAALVSVTTAAALTLLATGYRSHMQLRAAFDQANWNEQLARAATREANERLAKLTVMNGNRLFDEGDSLLALPWFVEALKLDDGNADREAAHRTRLAATLHDCPDLRATWFHDGRITGVAASADGQLVASAGVDGVVRVRPAAGGAGRDLRHPAAVERVAFLADGRVATLAAGRVRTWDGGRETLWPEPTDIAFAVWQGGRVATADAKGQVRVWNAADGAPLADGPRLDGAVTALALSPDGARVAAGNGAGRVGVGGVTFEAGGPVAALAFSTDGTKLAVAAGPAARVFDAADGRPLSQPLAHREAITSVALSPDGAALVTAGLDDAAVIWDWAAGRPRCPPLAHNSDVDVARFAPGGRAVATAGDDNTARVWDAATGRPLTPRLRHNGTVKHLAYGPDGRLLLTGSGSGRARLWTVPDEARPDDVVPTEAAPACTCATGRHVLTGSPDGTVRVTDSTTGAVLGTFQAGVPVAAVALGDRAEFALVGGDDGRARVWDWRTGRPVGQPLRHGSRISACAFSRDGKFVATGSEDNTARVWRAESGEAVTPLLKHPGTVLRLRFHPTGRMLLTASKGDYARVWDAATGEPVTPGVKRAGWVARVLAARPGEVTWGLSEETRPVGQLMALAEWLSGHRIDATGGLAPLTNDEVRDAAERAGRAE